MSGKHEWILVINPGSTSTKVAVFDGEQECSRRDLEHTPGELAAYREINDQLPFRRKAVAEYLAEQNLSVSDLSAIAVRGGVVGELECGAYLVDQEFAERSLHSPAPHPANLAPVIGYELSAEAGGTTPVYVYDAVCGCGKPNPVYTITGVSAIRKPFLTHVLNSRAVAIEQARRDGADLKDKTYIVVHLGGGVTSNLIRNGRIETFTGDDEGGFSPERSGGLPVRALVTYCFRSGKTEKQIQKELKGKGGLMSYLGTGDLREVEQRMAEDPEAQLVYEAMVLQLAQEIGSLAPVVNGKIDRIILTGGMAFSQRLTEQLTEKISFLAPVSVIPGTFEMEALAAGIHRVLNGRERARRLREDTSERR